MLFLTFQHVRTQDTDVGQCASEKTEFLRDCVVELLQRRHNRSSIGFLSSAMPVLESATQRAQRLLHRFEIVPVDR